ncbi:MAG TPA: phosphoribosylformylglycinamidine synthase subunit PurQ [Chitinophagaceae bacterium]|nr:MAG: phosphoribosylformylglycinamidine synthase I [Bacteroidetes bacterium OLB11]HMN33221.1 phosphoribosylformylglycinamidine synthase subunit PurQ [Chitinophagaceae bacterium]
MKFGIVVFPGSNCDRDMQHALEQDLKQEVIMLWHKDKDLSMFSKEDCIVLPGGFSYGDYLRCGALARFSPMMESVIEFANQGGKVLGVCNGFQILCEAGLLPGALLQNDHQKFICKNTYIISENTAASISKDIVNTTLQIPIAHGEGRYYASAEIIQQLEKNNQIIFKYCDKNGNVGVENPNGTTDFIAGICNENRNVFGMMPHPERACSSILGNIDGQKIFRSIINNN